MAIRTVVWGENIHERINKVVAEVYPKGMHTTIADALNTDSAISATTATLEQDEHGLPQARLDETDVLLWWGHKDHGAVSDEIVERVAKRVWEGMGLIVLHSGHFSKIFKRLMGTPCDLKWREAGERERIWVANPGHPIAQGLGDGFAIENEEMYGEHFDVPEPLETVFISWFQGGEVFRSGLTYRRGNGNIFYFRPGHETYPTYHQAPVQHVLRNAVKWAYNANNRNTSVHYGNVPVEKAPEPIVERGPKLHAAGEEGYK
jgi:trehalose utilization protein